MKIPLNTGADRNRSSQAAARKVLERDIFAARKGDWNAKNSLVRQFMPLITSLAQKRAKDIAAQNRLIEAGKIGLFHAVRKYRPSVGPEKFQIFALAFIEKSMDGKTGGFFARLFGG